MYVTDLDKVKQFVPEMAGAEKVLKQVPIGRAEGTPTFSFRVFTIEPGGHTPYHSHLFEHINYVIQGQGTLVGKETRQPLKKGNFVLIPPGEMHQYQNTAARGNLVIICAVPKEYE